MIPNVYQANPPSWMKEHNAKLLYEGEWEKEGASVFSFSRTRWFKVYEDGYFMYIDRSNGVVKNKLYLKNIISVDREEKSRIQSPYFTVNTPERTWKFKAKNENQLQHLLKVFRDLKSKLNKAEYKKLCSANGNIKQEKPEILDYSKTYFGFVVGGLLVEKVLEFLIKTDPSFRDQLTNLLFCKFRAALESLKNYDDHCQKILYNEIEKFWRERCYKSTHLSLHY
eukprot:UN01927